ncbi:MAG: hypothetical protein WCE51_06765 [Chthoniobacterales bacterium]
MKTRPLLSPLLFSLFLGAITLQAGIPAQEKAFTDKYKAAFEAKDTATLYTFLYTQNANPMALQFYQMMVTNGAGDKISMIELVDLTPNDIKKAEEPMDGPGGIKMKLPLKPIKKLKVSVEHKDENGSSTSKRESYVAEKDGRLVIPVPVNVN